MATVLNRTTMQLIRSANTPDYESDNNWLINPDLSQLDGYVSQKYWKVEEGEGDGYSDGYGVFEMSSEEKSIVDASNLLNVVESSITRAARFGNEIMIQFSAENVLMGITQAGKTAAVTIYLHKLSHYITTGSLYAAISEIDYLIGEGLDESLSPFVTETRLLAYKAMIMSYLGL